jgi:signal transduction histidine kinase
MGISEEELPHIFEAFRRARETQMLGVGGVGLGLTLVKDIVEAHQGKIEVESEAGKGSTFTLFLPLAKSGQMNNTETRH